MSGSEAVVESAPPSDVSDDSLANPYRGYSLKDFLDIDLEMTFNLTADIDSIGIVFPSSIDIAKVMPKAVGAIRVQTRRTRATGSSRFSVRSGLGGISSYVQRTKLKNIPLGCFPNMTLLCLQNGPFDMYLNLFYFKRSLRMRSFFSNAQHIVLNVAMNIARYHIMDLVHFGEIKLFKLCDLEQYSRVMVRLGQIECAPSNSFMESVSYLPRGVVHMFLIGFERALMLLANKEGGPFREFESFDKIDFLDPLYTGSDPMKDPPALTKDDIRELALEISDHHTFVAVTAGCKDTFDRMSNRGCSYMFEINKTNQSEDARYLRTIDSDAEQISKNAYYIARKYFRLDKSDRVLSVFDVGLELFPYDQGSCLLVNTAHVQQLLRRMRQDDNVVISNANVAAMMDEKDIEIYINNVSDQDVDDPSEERFVHDDLLGNMESVFSCMAQMQASLFPMYSSKGYLGSIHSGHIRTVPSVTTHIIQEDLDLAASLEEENVEEEDNLTNVIPLTEWLKKFKEVEGGVKLSPAREECDCLGLNIYHPPCKALLGATSPLIRSSQLSRLSSLVAMVLSESEWDQSLRRRAYQDLRKGLADLRKLINQYEKGMLEYKMHGVRLEFFMLGGKSAPPSSGSSRDTYQAEVTVPSFDLANSVLLARHMTLAEKSKGLLKKWMTPLERIFNIPQLISIEGLTPEIKTALYARSELLCHFFNVNRFDSPFIKALRPYVPAQGIYDIPGSLERPLSLDLQGTTGLSKGTDTCLMPLGKFKPVTSVRVVDANVLKEENKLVTPLVSVFSRVCRLPRVYAKAWCRVRSTFMKYAKIARMDEEAMTNSDELSFAPGIVSEADLCFGLFDEVDYSDFGGLDEDHRYDMHRELARIIADVYHQEWFDHLIVRNPRLASLNITINDFPATENELKAFHHQFPQAKHTIILSLESSIPFSSAGIERQGVSSTGKSLCPFLA